MPQSTPLSNLRRGLRQGAALASVAGRAARSPELRRSLLGQVGGRRGVAGQVVVGEELSAPDGVADFPRHVYAQQDCAAAPAEVVARLRDLGQVADWLTIHSSWRGDVPATMTAGESFAQQILLMDIPAEARWTVAAADEAGFALRGTGPMGITLGLWATVAGHGTGSTVRLDAALDGAPVRGPIGSTAVRSLERALHDSLTELTSSLSGATSPRLRLSSAPVLHVASGRELDPSTPVVVGVGQVVQREPDAGRDPVALSAAALRAALADSGATTDLLAAADLVYAVPSASWTYGDQAALVADHVGARPEETVQSSPYGGDGGQLVVNDAAQEVVEGRAQVVLLSGAEAGSTLAWAQRTGVTLDWPRQADDVAPGRMIGVDRRPNNEAETGVGLGAPIYTYALMESAVRGRLGRTPAQHRTAIARLWSRFSEVAGGNPFAWSPSPVSADVIATATPDNRAVSEPYTKLMCANLQVDLAAGVIVTSVAAAEAAGVPQDRWVFVHAGTSGHDEWFVSERADLSRSPAIAALGEAALEHAGVGIDDVAHVDLYACFPSAVEIGADALGLPVDDESRPLTATGGLTFAGGPGNNYGTHALASLVPVLRADPTSRGLCTSLGWYATKHALGIYSATPPARAYEHLRPVVPHPPRRPVGTSYDGVAVVEAYTVPYDRDGAPEAGVLSLLTPSGSRVLVRTTDPAVVDVLVEGDALGCEVLVEGERVTLTGRCGEALPEPPRPPVRTERHDAVLLITLDRPEVRNAIDARTAEELERAVDAAEADPRVRAIVLTGAGDTFCAGMDLKAAARGELPLTPGRGPLGLTGRPPTKPLVVAIEGSALAGGCELALAADLIVAAEDAELGIPEVRRGLAAAAGGVLRLRERLPRNVAMELALLGAPMGAARLAELGLVNRVTPRGQALAVALRLAAEVAANAPLSVAVGKRIVDESPSWDADEAFDRQTELASPVILSDDAREGVAAFAERRTPVWTGR
jgi:acetyl-CoA C-acetyltransferase